MHAPILNYEAIRESFCLFIQTVGKREPFAANQVHFQIRRREGRMIGTEKNIVDSEKREKYKKRKGGGGGPLASLPSPPKSAPAFDAKGLPEGVVGKLNRFFL